MSESAGYLDLRSYYTMIVKKRYLFIGTFIAVATIIIATSYFMPKKFQASTIVLVESSPVANPLEKKQSDALRAKQRLAILKHLLFNRNNISRVIKKLDLDSHIRGPLAYEALVEDMQDGLNVMIKSGNFFQIIFFGDTPKITRDVVNTLADQYIEDTLQSKRQGSLLAMEFHNEQLLEYRRRLEEAEAVLKAFKEENVNLLPRRSDITLSRIQEYEATLMVTRLGLKELKKKKKTIEGRLADEKPMVVDSVSNKDSYSGRLSTLEKKRMLLLASYTDDYPEVVQITDEIAAIKLKMEESRVGGEDDSNVESSSANPVYQRLRENLMKVESGSSTLEAREEGLLKEIEKLKLSLGEIPGEEQTLIKLERDARIYETIYNTLLTKLEQSKIAREMEKKEEAVIFKVVDPAVLPAKPAKPDRVMYILFSMIFGVGAGLGLVYLSENYLDTTFKGADDLKTFLGQNVIGVIPLIITEEERKRARRKDILVYSFTALFILCAMALFFREFINRYGLGKLPWVN